MWELKITVSVLQISTKPELQLWKQVKAHLFYQSPKCALFSQMLVGIYILKMYLFEREREGWQGRGRESQSDSSLSEVPEAGLHPGSWDGEDPKFLT